MTNKKLLDLQVSVTSAFRNSHGKVNGESCELIGARIGDSGIELEIRTAQGREPIFIDKRSELLVEKNAGVTTAVSVTYEDRKYRFEPTDRQLY